MSLTLALPIIHSNSHTLTAETALFIIGLPKSSIITTHTLFLPPPHPSAQVNRCPAAKRLKSVKAAAIQTKCGCV